VDRSTRNVWTFIALLAAAGVGLGILASDVSIVHERPFTLGWVVLTVAFAVAERCHVNIEVRREAHSLTFSEIPLTIGLLFASPIHLIIARVIGGVVGFAIVRRPPPEKVAFNGAQHVVEVAAVLLVFNAILGDALPVDPRGWFAAMLAVALGHLLVAVIVSTVMRIVGAPVTIRSVASVVAVSGSGALAGCAVALAASVVLWRDQRAWTILLVIAAALAYFFLSYIRIRERHQSLAALHEFTTSITATNDSAQLERAIVRGVAQLLRSNRVVLVADWGVPRRVEYTDGNFSVAESHPQSAVAYAEAVIGSGGSLVDAGLESIAGIALTGGEVLAARLAADGQYGLLIVDGRLANTRSFDDEDRQLLETAASQAGTAIQNSRLVNELREEATFRARQALHDEVTELPNSRGLAETLQRPLAAGSRLAVLTVRIDSLREVNETLGRAMGDELLQQVAARLSPLTEDGWCAKTATDEFTVVVRGGNDEATAMGERVIAAFEAPVQCADVALAITAGIGIVLAPDHGRETEILLRRASLAASRSRVEGTKVTTWAADRDPYDPQRLAIAADLRDAIPAGELQVHFQPQVDIDSGLVTGAEALVRWRHPRLGELRPDQFIAAAEYTGAIDALTEFVLSVAARTCATWREQGWDLDVSVNLSARNLANVAFADLVEGILDDTGLDPAALTLELTESSIMTEAEGAMGTLTAIHDLGVSLSIDDFGTGYSSLAHLRKLPVSEIKIDKSFVFDLTTSQSDEAIVRSMIDLGHHLGLTVVIEGVETVEVRRRLAEMGADRIQGYLLSRPMPVAAFEQWIADRPVRMAELSTSDAEASAPNRIADHER
jgi:diguanylate cyclase (GGDEF)-like protein